MPVRPTLLHRMALVSFLLFHKNLDNLREFFEQIVYPPPPAKNCPYAYGCKTKIKLKYEKYGSKWNHFLTARVTFTVTHIVGFLYFC